MRLSRRECVRTSHSKAAGKKQEVSWVWQKKDRVQESGEKRRRIGRSAECVRISISMVFKASPDDGDTSRQMEVEGQRNKDGARKAFSLLVELELQRDKRNEGWTDRRKESGTSRRALKKKSLKPSLVHFRNAKNEQQAFIAETKCL